MTIAKNTNRAKQAIQNAHDVVCYSLSNCFDGKPLSAAPVIWKNNQIAAVTVPEFLAKELETGKLSFAEGKFTLHVHHGLWYEFKA